MSSDLQAEPEPRAYVLRPSWIVPTGCFVPLVCVGGFMIAGGQGAGVCFGSLFAIGGIGLVYKYLRDFPASRRSIVIRGEALSFPSARDTELYFPLVRCEIDRSYDENLVYIVETAGRDTVRLCPNDHIASADLQALLQALSERLDEVNLINREDFIAICELVTRPPNTF